MTHTASASITKVFPRHSVKSGFEFRKFFVNYFQFGSPSSSYSFDSGWTQQEIATPSVMAGFPLASFLLGLPSGGSISHTPTFAVAAP